MSHGERPRLPPHDRLALGTRVGVDLGLPVAEGKEAGSEPEAVGAKTNRVFTLSSFTKRVFVPDRHHPEAASVSTLPVPSRDLSPNVLAAHGALHLDGTVPVLRARLISRGILTTENNEDYFHI